MPSSRTDRDPPAVIVIVGAGPRGAGFLERLGAGIPELLPDRGIEVHFVDPFPPGAGRVWRHAQSPLLRMNSMAEDVTMFTDDSVRCAGPIRPGPSLWEWAVTERERLPEAEIDDELRELAATSFPSRQLQSRYLAWFFDTVIADLPGTVDVKVHATTVDRITGPPSGRQRVWLADRPEPLPADIVVLTLGHLDARPSGEPAELVEYAAEHGLYYLPPAYSADVDLSGIEPGQPVLMRGLGLAFIDLMVLLTEGRGGRFATDEHGRLTYLPSGREPVLYAGSRRGVPYHAKTNYRLRGPRPRFPKFFGPDTLDRLVAEHERLDYFEHVWPVQAKEVAWGYYHELFLGHPDRVSLDWAEFERRYAGLDWGTDRMVDLIERAVPAEDDRIDFERLDHPMRGVRFDTFEDLQRSVRDYVTADLARRHDDTFSADLGAFYALLSTYGQLPRLIAAGTLTAGSRMRGVETWWIGFFSFFASGPPGDRLEQLLALSRAGLVRFLGADMWVRAENGRFVAGSAGVGDVVEATALVDARLPAMTVRHTEDGLLRSLAETGAAVEETVVDPGRPPVGTGLLRVAPADGRLVDGAGRPHPRRFALGPFTTLRTAAAFARPHTNAPTFRSNDASARAVLEFLATGNV